MVTRSESCTRSRLTRVGQFVLALIARPLTIDEWRNIAIKLSSAEQSLFRQMKVNDQRHSYRVMCSLVQAGETQRDLLVAALLHDVGKTRYPLRLWERSLVVLVRRIFPKLAGRLASQNEGDPDRYKRPFVAYEHHSCWGSEMATNAGSSSLVVHLIRHHHDQLRFPSSTASSEIELLRLLQNADNAN